MTRLRHSLAATVIAVASSGVLASAASTARAQEARGFGLGLIIGNPTGVSGKGFLSPEHAIDGAVGFGLLGGEDLQLHADFLWHFPIKQWSSAALDLYLGVGPWLGFHGHGGRNERETDVSIGARAPFGLAVMFDAPFDVFLEVAAGLRLVRKVGFHLDAAIGGRYWF
jgi:hypothetical protein